MSRNQHDAQIRGHEAHRIILRSREMSEKLSVSGKTVSAEKQRPLIDRRRRDRIDAATRAQLNRSFDVAGRSLSGRARFNARLDVSIDIIEMKNYRTDCSVRKALAPADDLVATLQVERSRVMRQQLGVANNYRRTGLKHVFLGDGFEHDLRSDPGRITHGYSNTRQWLESRSRHGRIWR